MEQLPSTATGVLRQFATSLTGIGVFSDQLIEAVQGGELNPLELRAFIKSIEMALDRTNKETQSNQLRAADLFPGDKFTAYGVEFTKGDVYTKYDYSACGDPTWEMLQQATESAKSAQAAREAFLKTVKTPMTIVDDSSGEIVTIFPPKVTRTPGLKVSIK